MGNNNFNLFQRLEGFGLFLIITSSLLVFAYVLMYRSKREELYKRGITNEEDGTAPEKMLTFLQALSIVRKRLLNDRPIGLSHSLVIFGFIFYMVGFVANVLQTVLNSLTGIIVLTGITFNIFQIILNLGIILTFIGSLIAIVRRLSGKVQRLEKTARHFVPSIALLIVAISGSIHEGFKLLLNKESQVVFYAAGAPFVYFINALKLTPEVFSKAYYIAFLFYFLLTLALVVLWHSSSKLFHMTAGMVSIGRIRGSKLGRVKNTEIPINKMFKENKELDDSEEFGLQNISDFSSSQLRQIDSCAECGRCDSVCPAFKSGKTLSPRKMIENQKKFLNLHNKQGEINILGLYPELSQTVWECNMCYACENVCPSLVEHVDKTIGLRRNLVLNSGETTKEFKKVIRSLEKFQNPYGIDNSVRLRFAEELGIPLLEKGQKVDFVLWIGCHGYFDTRMKNVIENLTYILNKAGKSFAIFKNEICCGDVARRIGDEFKFQEILNKNITMFNEYEVENILTICPHCFNSMKNEYPTFGSKVSISHYVEVLPGLIDTKIDTAKQSRKKVFYHDSCYLGRINGLYNQPREILKLMDSTCEVLSISCEKEDSLCCGGGGGRVWMEENIKNRPSIIKLEEIIKKDIDTIVTSCPYCLNIFSDAVLTSGKQIEVKDLLEVAGDNLKR